MKTKPNRTTRHRSSISGAYVSKAAADANKSTTVKEARPVHAYNGWVVYVNSKVWNRYPFTTCAAAWNKAESETGVARAELCAQGWEVRAVSVSLRLK